MDVKLIKAKIKSGEIRSWPDVYGYTTPQEMSKVLGRSPKHWKHVKSRPLDISIGDMVKIIEVLKISKTKFLELVEGED